MEGVGAVETRHEILLWLWYRHSTFVTPIHINITHWNMNYCCGSGTRVTPFHINITTLEHDLLLWLWDTHSAVVSPFS